MIHEMEKVFEIWARYSNLKFKRVYNTDADIIIGFAARNHGDKYENLH